MRTINSIDRGVNGKEKGNIFGRVTTVKHVFGAGELGQKKSFHH